MPLLETGVYDTFRCWRAGQYTPTTHSTESSIPLVLAASRTVSVVAVEIRFPGIGRISVADPESGIRDPVLF
jgi:hypothetical protein